VAGDVSLADGAVGSIMLSSARVGGAVIVSGPTARAGDIDLSGGQFGTVRLVDGKAGEVRAQTAVIAHDLVVSDVSLASADLTAVKVDGNFFLRRSHDAPLFRNGRGLVLRNASVHAFEDRAFGCTGFRSGCPEPWPAGCNPPRSNCQRLDLNGFTYTGFAFMGRHNVRDAESNSERGLGEDGRDIGWWKGWLGREAYAPQPYEQLASALRSVGRPEDAVAIEYAGKDSEYETAPFTRKVFLIVDRFLVGYGYHPGNAMWFAAALVLIGVVVVRRSGQEAQLAKPGEPATVSALVYSFDTLIPLVTLRETDAKAEFTGWAGYYFFVQKIAGYVLATFLVAGISGLTK
ncbi:MAG TPA: hypothetical protein VHS78_09280, partial [Candidatus Elarobacter sp.]|nr:hypothetical protein [Candidatus Elarobacter sp.]